MNIVVKLDSIGITPYETFVEKLPFRRKTLILKQSAPYIYESGPYLTYLPVKGDHPNITFFIYSVSNLYDYAALPYKDKPFEFSPMTDFGDDQSKT